MTAAGVAVFVIGKGCLGGFGEDVGLEVPIGGGLCGRVYPLAGVLWVVGVYSWLKVVAGAKGKLRGLWDVNDRSVIFRWKFVWIRDI